MHPDHNPNYLLEANEATKAIGSAKDELLDDIKFDRVDQPAPPGPQAQHAAQPAAQTAAQVVKKKTVRPLLKKWRAIFKIRKSLYKNGNKHDPGPKKLYN